MTRQMLRIVALLLGWLAVGGAVALAESMGKAPSTGPLALSARPTMPAPAPTPAAIVTLHGEVDDYTASALFRSFAAARKAGAKTIILDLDTPGGLVTAGLEISRFLRRQDDLHVIAYVSNKAYSAGAMISVAANEIVMAPAAVVGDCAPIVFNTGGELQPMPAAERAKAQSPIVSDFDASADRNGYDPLLLEAMVITERTVYFIQGPDGQKRFVDEKEYPTLTAHGWKSVPGVPSPLDGPDTLLTLQTDIAQKIGLSRGVYESATDLASQRNLKIVADLTPGAGEQFVELLGNAAVRGVLLTIFLSCLYIALSSPGHGAAEASAIVALGLLIGVPLLTGYAQWWEVVAIFAGLALLAFEIFVFPGHGVSAVMGIVLMLAGLLMTFIGKEPSGMPGWLPGLGQTWANLRQGVLAITGGLGASLLLWFWLRTFLPRLPYFNRLILTTTSGTPVGNGPGLFDAPGAAGAAPVGLSEVGWPGVGTRGIAATDLRPGGAAEFFDLALNDTRTVAVVSESGFVSAGTPLTVRQARGNHIVVRRAPSPPSPATESTRVAGTPSAEV
jgi:membrane-bound serine protease (ClpP class)